MQWHAGRLDVDGFFHCITLGGLVLQHPFACLTYHLRSNLRLSDTQMYVGYDIYKLGIRKTAHLGSFWVCALSKWLHRLSKICGI